MADMKERYLGNDVYAQWDDPSWTYSNQIKLTKQQWFGDDLKRIDSIFLQPEVLAELIRFAHEIGWSRYVDWANATPLTREGFIEKHLKPLIEQMTDEEYAAAEEDAQRKRDAKEGFDE